jgi:hypothetical protein
MASTISLPSRPSLVRILALASSLRRLFFQLHDPLSQLSARRVPVV